MVINAMGTKTTKGIGYFKTEAGENLTEKMIPHQSLKEMRE
jgi:hypothetical protein